MKLFGRLRPSPALIVALSALVLAMSGAAVALPGKGQVKSNDIADDAVKAKHIKKNAVRSQQVKGKTLKGNDLKDDAIKSKQVAPNGLDSSDLADVETLGLARVAATDGATPAAARAAAPETPLHQQGQLTIYGKCFRDTAADQVFAEILIKTAADGAAFNGVDALHGGNTAAEFLNTGTPEAERLLTAAQTDAGAPDATLQEGEFAALAPDGARLIGQLLAGAKNGALGDGNGVYGEGNACLFGGEVAG